MKFDKQIQEALIDAFPSKESLERMLDHELGKCLNEIAGGANLADIVFSLMKKARAHGWFEELIEAAHNSNPGNPKLKDIVEKQRNKKPNSSEEENRDKNTNSSEEENRNKNTNSSSSEKIITMVAAVIMLAWTSVFCSSRTKDSGCLIFGGLATSVGVFCLITPNAREADTECQRI